MKRFIVCALSCMLLLSGCAMPTLKKEEVETETEIPTPNITTDTERTLSNEEITISYTLQQYEAFGADSNEDYFTVYSNSNVFDSCVVKLAYMPHTNWYAKDTQNTYFKDLGNGYTAYAVTNGMSMEECINILNSIQVVSYTPVE